MNLAMTYHSPNQTTSASVTIFSQLFFSLFCSFTRGRCEALRGFRRGARLCMRRVRARTKTQISIARMSECVFAQGSVFVCVRVARGKSDCVSSGICSAHVCAQRLCLCPCVYVFVAAAGANLKLSSLMCLGGPEESRALEGVDVSALRDL